MSVHVHHLPAPILTLSQHVVCDAPLDDELSIVAVTRDPAHAHRIAELLELHGLVDIPDTVAELQPCPWPAPNPETRRGH